MVLIYHQHLPNFFWHPMPHENTSPPHFPSHLQHSSLLPYQPLYPLHVIPPFLVPHLPFVLTLGVGVGVGFEVLQGVEVGLKEVLMVLGAADELAGLYVVGEELLGQGVEEGEEMPVEGV